MVNNTRRCQRCRQEHCAGVTEKVLFKRVFPLRLCSNRKCNHLYGFWGFMTYILPNPDGTFIYYEGNPYWSTVIKAFKGEITIHE